MGVDAITSLGRGMLIEVATLILPVLLVALVVSLAVNLAQVLTSLQDQTLSAVPRLLATGGTMFVLMPWMWRHLSTYTLRVFADFHGVLR